MTFEEFFIKKRIDLDQLKHAEPVLFDEFRFDYAQMGEKSFDHTKKYWFNKLRKTYHLKPKPKPELKKPETNPLATQAEPLSSPTIVEKSGYTPRFKPRVTSPQPKPDSTPEKDAEGALAGSQHPVLNENYSAESSNTEELSVPVPENNPPIPKPAYKPRFNAAALKKESEQTEKPADIEEEKLSDPPVTPDPEVKPAYKPRFKPGMMNKPKPKDDEGENNK